MRKCLLERLQGRRARMAAHDDGCYLSPSSGAPRSDSALRRQGRHQPLHTGRHVSVQHHLLPGRLVLLLHRTRGEEQQRHLQAVHDDAETGHL